MEINEKIKNKTEELLSLLGIEAEISIEEREQDEESKHEYIWIKLDGDDASKLIGFHGRGLESLETIISMMFEGELIEMNKRIIVEINNYREERIKYIESVARRAAIQVKESNQEMELSPMKAFERRIVHMEIKKEGLASESIGEGRDRRVVIKP
jgi:spoIIIJ-associated protein